MSGLEPLEALLLYVPLSIIGLWRWSYWLIRRLGAAAYRPKVRPWPEGEKRPSVTIVTPVYNEDPELFDKAVRSWMLNGVEEIVRGDTAGTKFCVIGLRDGEVIGGATVNSPKDMAVLRRLVGMRKRPSRKDLEDPTFDLKRTLAS
jgi:hypothetical protein